MKRSLVAQAEKPPLSDYTWDHEGWLIWNQEAYSSAVEGLLFDSHNADESDKEDVNEYFGDDCLSDKRDWNSSDICYLKFTWTIFIRVWHFRYNPHNYWPGTNHLSKLSKV